MLEVLPKVVEATQNVILASASLDFLIMMNVSLLSIQNMTWNGAQGFSSSPFSDKFFAPYNPTIVMSIDEDLFDDYVPAINVGLPAGGGYYGTTHTQRCLTYVVIDLASHEIPGYAPGSAFWVLELLLGRINNLTQMGDFTTQSGNYTGNISW
ncbi:hypothetical protein BD289DRAFT_481286 [Coniella lustricola]|uniref:Uncharacterized protein n=1 Tax=Coniella lustricola TaxID=2025994 RepID=A0A2T3ACR2_9PEZI|nr:hypothetical protein BD289DRAFT_481286 [Coniella lustricola]